MSKETAREIVASYWRFVNAGLQTRSNSVLYGKPWQREALAVWQRTDAHAEARAVLQAAGEIWA